MAMSFESLNQLSATTIGGGSTTPRRPKAATRPSSMPMVRPFLECRSGSQLIRRSPLLSIRPALLNKTRYRLGRAISNEGKALTDLAHPSVIIIAWSRKRTGAIASPSEEPNDALAVSIVCSR